MSAKPNISIIIPVRTETAYLKETIAHLQKQTFKNFELLVITDEKEKIPGALTFASHDPGPAHKRNLGTQKAKGEILAFLDDDSYPSENWLKNAVKIFKESSKVAAVCGPCLTPPQDNLFQKASGLVWSSWFGAGGAGTYRNKISPRREVDDFPSVNLLVRKKDFQKVGGFDVNHWPGEDTKLCLDLTKKLKKKIIYDPKVLVFHHRRPVLIPHLKQISRYAQRRGFFAKKFPQTSLRLGYLSPSFFVYGFLLGVPFSLLSLSFKNFYSAALNLYFLLLLLAGVQIWSEEKNLRLALLTTFSIFATHFWYGLLFPFGYFQKDMGVIPHKVDKKRKKYIGG